MLVNPWCEALGIAVPDLRTVKHNRDANTYALFLVALLAEGKPMTLVEVAERFEDADVTDAMSALKSLQRCKPARAPAYREDDRYSLDPHDDELRLWVFRLGLRPPRVLLPQAAQPKPTPIPGPNVRLAASELNEGWKDQHLFGWSAQRLILAALDAQGEPMMPQDVVRAVTERTSHHGLSLAPSGLGRRGAAVAILPDGRWAVSSLGHDALMSARRAVRERVEVSRRTAHQRTTPEQSKAVQAAWETRRLEHAAELSKLRRALVYGFPFKQPVAFACVDVGKREIETFIGDEAGLLRDRLAAFDVIGGIDVRGLLRAIGFDGETKRLADLGPPQKTKLLNARGRTLKITADLLIQGSCGISQPLGDMAKLTAYIAAGDETKLRRRLEATAKSLFAFYQYSRLHGCVRLKWGFLDERLSAPWIDRDEPGLRELMTAAFESALPLEVVVGSAPGWEEPWSRGKLAHVHVDASGWHKFLVDEDRLVLHTEDVQLARIVGAPH